MHMATATPAIDLAPEHALEQAPELTLEHPLPSQLVGASHGWFMQYRRYPVFSRRWALLRLRPALSVVGLFMAVTVATVILTSTDGRAAGGVVVLSLQLLLPLLVGPWLARWVRLQGWPMAREGWSLLATLIAVTTLLSATAHHVGEPIKQALAEATGSVDAQGRRLAYRMMVGISITGRDDRPADAAPGTPNAIDAPHPRQLPYFSINTLNQGLVMFWLAGGVALLSWRREVSGLQRLQQEQALQQAQAERLAAQAQRREAEMRLSVLAAQVEPHFLFNTLAGVRSAISTDPARASEMVDRLVDYLRASIPRLRDDGRVHATVGAQFDGAAAYLALMRARLPRLSYTLQASSELREAYCPPLMLISLVENAVKHGVEPKIGPAHVDLVASQPTPGRVRVAVQDDGAGFVASGAGSGLGLANIRERLRELYGDAAVLELKTRAGGGVEAAIELPLEIRA